MTWEEGWLMGYDSYAKAAQDLEKCQQDRAAKSRK
eukprot:COSAG04_NODE_1392_length_6955_cov_22.011960_8_plen_35_part_00